MTRLFFLWTQLEPVPAVHLQPTWDGHIDRIVVRPCDGKRRVVPIDRVVDDRRGLVISVDLAHAPICGVGIAWRRRSGHPRTPRPTLVPIQDGWGVAGLRDTEPLRLIVSVTVAHTPALQPVQVDVGPRSSSGSRGFTAESPM